VQLDDEDWSGGKSKADAAHAGEETTVEQAPILDGEAPMPKEVPQRPPNLAPEPCSASRRLVLGDVGDGEPMGPEPFTDARGGDPWARLRLLSLDWCSLLISW